MNYVFKKALTLFFLFLPVMAFAQGANYVIRGRDVLRITVYDHPDLNTVVRVTEVGTITFPLLGEVEVKGLTVHQLGKEIAGLLSKGLIVNPQVNVFVEQFKTQRVTVIGEVNKPGQYNLIMDEPTYVADIISNCLGVTRDAGETLTILRKQKDGQKKIFVELSRLLRDGDLSQNVELQEGDLLYVPRAGYFYIYGQVNRPGYYRIEPDLTVIKTISMAGGSTGMGSTRGIRIIRKTKDGETTLKVKLNNPIQPGDEFFAGGDMSQDIKIEDGDVIFLPRSAYFYVYGEVGRPGNYKLEPGLTVIKAISMAGGVTNKASTSSIEVIRKTDGKESTIEVEMDSSVQGEDVIIVPESFF